MFKSIQQFGGGNQSVPSGLRLFNLGNLTVFCPESSGWRCWEPEEVKSMRDIGLNIYMRVTSLQC